MSAPSRPSVAKVAMTSLAELVVTWIMAGVLFWLILLVVGREMTLSVSEAIAWITGGVCVRTIFDVFVLGRR